jgi:RHS repeat-associated protein
MTTSGGPAIAWSAKYDPFGNVLTTTSATAMPLRFPGQYFQIEDGLSYNWHRNYDPSLGRYSQADPLGFVDGPGVYNYVNGSPAMKVDRDGRWTVQFGVAGGGTLFGFVVPQGGFGITFDGCGNVGVYGFGGIGIGAGVSAGAGLSLQGSNAPTIYHLRGGFSNGGLHGGAGLGGTLDGFQGETYGTAITGGGVTLGLSAGASGSASRTGTVVCGFRGCFGSANPLR